MAQPYVGEIRMFAGNFAPAGWMLCDGQILPIAENEALFNLIGTSYGGDGQETFALPNLQSRIPIHQGGGFVLAETGGVEQVTLTTQQIPSHPHLFFAVDSGTRGDTVSPAGLIPAESYNIVPYINDLPNGSFNANAINPSGGNQPHENRQPLLVINFIISLFGIFPSQT
jgi:microcystin-dependent protein